MTWAWQTCQLWTEQLLCYIYIYKREWKTSVDVILSNIQMRQSWDVAVMQRACASWTRLLAPSPTSSLLTRAHTHARTHASTQVHTHTMPQISSGFPSRPRMLCSSVLSCGPGYVIANYKCTVPRADQSRLKFKLRQPGNKPSSAHCPYKGGHVHTMYYAEVFRQTWQVFRSYSEL